MKTPLKSALLGTFASDLMILSVGVLTGVLTARLLLPEGRGVLAAVLLWPQLLALIGLLSLNDAATYRVSVRGSRTSVIAASVFWLSIFGAVVVLLCGYLLLPSLLGESRSRFIGFAQTYLLVFIPFNFISLVLLAIDQGELRFSRYNAMRMLVPLVYLICLVGLLATKSVSVGWVLAANCAGTIFVALSCLITKRELILEKPSISEIVELIRTAVKFHPAAVLAVLALQIDQLVVIMLFNDVVVGYYVVALTVASSSLSIVGGPFQKVLFPQLAAIPDGKNRAFLLARGVRQATVLLIGFSVLLAVLMPLLLPLLFGKDFQPAVIPALCLLTVYLLVTLKAIMIKCLRGLGEGYSGFMATAISLVMFLLLVWPLAKSFELVGVAVAMGVANLFALAYLIHHVRQVHGVSIQDLWGLTPRTVNEIWTGVTGMIARS